MVSPAGSFSCDFKTFILCIIQSACLFQFLKSLLLYLSSAIEWPRPVNTFVLFSLHFYNFFSANMEYDENFIIQFDDELLQIYFTEVEPQVSNNLQDFAILPSDAVQAFNTADGQTGLYINKIIKK